MGKNPSPKIILIDGNSLAYRAFYALPDTMRTTSGISTNAIYGFTTMLIKALEEKPDFAAIAFDLPGPTFRHREYKEYKATREKAPPTLSEQIPYVKEMAEAFEIPIYEVDGYEADDVIGTIAKKAEKEGYEVVILSGDLDPLQLVDKKIKVLTTRKGLTDTVLYGEKEVEERYGLKPSQLIDFKALKGDPSDNIPGVPKVGDKTASELLQEFGSLEEIFKNAEKIKKPALRENIKKNEPLAQLSKRLATIVTDAPVAVDFTKAKRGDIDWQKVLPAFEKFEFDSLVKKYRKGVAGYQTEKIIERKRAGFSEFNFKAVQTEKDFSDLLVELKKAPAFAFDLETTDLDTFSAKIVGISFSTESKSAHYLPISGDVPEKLKTIFHSDQLKIGHNLKYDLEILQNHDVSVEGPFFDTMVAAYLLDPVSGKLSLKALAKQFLGREMIKLLELIGKDAEYEDFSKVPLEVAADYACSDAEATFGLFEIFKLALKAQKIERLFYEVEMPLLEVLIGMETAGVCLDVSRLKEMSQEIDRELKELERHIYAIAGEIFNLNSPKQLAYILFVKLMLPAKKMKKSGPSTDIEVLEELAAEKHEIAEKLIDYRQLTKLKTTYVDVLPALAHPKTGRIHASFNQTITATGRLSSSDPNLQNIPAKGEWGRRIRGAFVPGQKGWAILAADYSQIELRVLAHLSQDHALLKAFREGKDIHQATADELGVSRDAAKTVNFGIIYGISDFGLAKSLGIKKTDAAAYINRYFERHPGIKKFMEETITAAREKGYTETLLGRRRPIPDINSPHGGIRSFAERTAINAPVQGSAADLIKLAMIQINSRLKTQGAHSRLILQVHDELVFECPEEEVNKVKKIVEEEMINALKLDVPLKVDVGAGKSWAQAKE